MSSAIAELSPIVSSAIVARFPVSSYFIIPYMIFLPVSSIMMFLFCERLRLGLLKVIICFFWSFFNYSARRWASDCGLRISITGSRCDAADGMSLELITEVTSWLVGLYLVSAWDEAFLLTERVLPRADSCCNIS